MFFFRARFFKPFAIVFCSFHDFINSKTRGRSSAFFVLPGDVLLLGTLDFDIPILSNVPTLGAPLPLDSRFEQLDA